MNQNARTRSRDGFTLVEMLIVLTIAAIVSGVAIQSVGRSLNASRIDRSAAVIASTLRQARTTAARLRQPIRVSFDSVDMAIRLRNHATPDSLYQQFYFDAASELHLTQMAATDTQLVFYPNGLADGAGSIDIAATSAFRRRITVNRAGQIRITTLTSP